MNIRTIFFLFVAIVSLIGAMAYVPPNADDVILLFKPMSPPQSDNVILFFNEPIVQIVINYTTIDTECPNTTIFHNQNLSCFTNVSTNELYISWSVNDSRVTIIGSNTSATVFDDPTLADYNMPGCWDITVTANGSSSSDSSTFEYCIDDTAPTFTQSCNNTHLYHNQDLACQVNATDSESDAIVYTVNDSRVSINGSGYISDNPTLSDYNMPNGWNISITINDTVKASTTSFIYRINDTAPTFNESIGNITAYTIGSFNITYNWSDNESDGAIFITNCTQANFTSSNVTRTYTFVYVAGNVPIGTYLCNLRINDTVLQSSQVFQLNVLNATTTTLGANLSKFIPVTNETPIIFNSTLNTLTQYNDRFQNVTINNSMWNVTNFAPATGTIQVKRNVSRTDVIVGCACVYNVSNKTNLSGTSYTSICQLPPTSSKQVWCWTDFVNLNISKNSTSAGNITFDMDIRAI